MPAALRREPGCSAAHNSVAATRRAHADPACTATPGDSMASLRQELLDLADRLGRIEILGTGLGAVHDRVAAVQPEWILQCIEPLAGGLVAAVDDPAVCRQQCSGTKIAVAVPPVTWATRGATRAQDAGA